MLGKLDPNVRPMEYPVLSGSAPSLPAVDFTSPSDLVARVRELEAQLQERDRQFARQLEAARRQALDQGRQQAGGDQKGWREKIAQSLHAALEDFRSAREDYLARVEHEVVRLALAIAERILHRESQLDPLLLAGVVRVALHQLADSTTVRLRVPSAQSEMWSEMLRLMPGLPLRPEVVPDPALEPCGAVLETSLGSVDLGVHAQIEEIERGFFDLLAVRRDPSSDAVLPAPPAGRNQA